MAMRHLPLLREKQKSFSTDWMCKIFLGPVVTDKAYSKADQKIYTVKVHPEATKISIARAFHQLFEIKPIAINVLNLKGKTKKRRLKGREINIKKANIKKAMIRLPADTKFDFGNA